MIETSRAEYLAECKTRALKYLDDGETREAFTSMLSDLRHHTELENHPGCAMGVGFMLLPGWIDNPIEVRRWIVGFN